MNLQVNGKQFEVHKTRKFLPEDFNCKNRDLYSVYKSFSRTKCEIYEDWISWGLNSKVENFGVFKGSISMFSMRGTLKINDEICGIEIKPTRNIIYRFIK